MTTQPTAPTFEESRPATGTKSLYGLLRRLLRTVGPLSDGMLGLRHGFEGVMLEYVYRNEPSGRFVVGKGSDGALNTPGWRGIRERCELMKTALREVIKEQGAGRQALLLDVACGGGRYVETLREFPPEAVDATLCDYAGVNVHKARLASESGVSAHTKQADAFSDDLSRVLRRPNLIIVSGLHEILSDDVLTKHHFVQLRGLLEPGGTLLYTGQPHYLQLELIARTLNSHTGGPWVMRLRSAELIRGWAEAGGFGNFKTQMDT